MALDTKKLDQKTSAPAENKRPQNRQATEQSRQSAEVASSVAVVDENLNIRSADVALIANLGNPANKDTIGKPGEEGHDVKSRIVGYRLKNVSEQPLSVVEFGLGADANTNRLSHGADAAEKQVAPGEEFDVTTYEAAILLATPEINAEITGGEHPASGVYSTPSQNSGGIEEKSASRIKFHLKLKEGSIRDLPYIDVITADWGLDEKTGKNKVTKKEVNKGFEKFAPLAESNRKRRASGTRTSTPAAPKRNMQAEEFLKAAKAAATKK